MCFMLLPDILDLRFPFHTEPGHANVNVILHVTFSSWQLSLIIGLVITYAVRVVIRVHCKTNYLHL